MAPPFWAFISYSHADGRHAQWLHRWLEGYKLPKKLVGTVSERLALTRPANLKKIYLDREEFSAGHSLDGHITAALDQSLNLIVICSPAAVASRWVNEEVRHFQSLGRGDRIFCYVVDGEPNALNGPTQCLPTALQSPDAGTADVIAADVRRGIDKPRIAALRLVAGIVDVGFDDLRQREEERRSRWQRMVIGGTSLLVALFATLALIAWQQRNVAQKETILAEVRRIAAEKAEGQAQASARQARAAEQTAKDQQAKAEAAEQMAKQRQSEAEAARREAEKQFKDATLRRMAFESKAMLDGTRDGGALLSARVALAGLAMQPRADLLGTLQAAIAAGDDSQRAWDTPGESVHAVAYSPDGRLIVAATASRNSEYHLRFWRADTGEPDGAAIRLREFVKTLAFSADGQRVITADSGGTIAQWDVAARRAAGPAVNLPGAGFNAIATSAAGDRWVTTGWARGSNLVLWTPSASGHSPHPLVGHPGSVWGVAFSRDGHRIVSAGDADKTVRLWDADTGQAMGEPLVGHTDRVTSVAFSPDGTTIASGSFDKTIRLWRMPPEQPAGLRIDDAGTGIKRVLFSPDGSRIAAADEDGKVRVWDSHTGKPLGPVLTGHQSGIGVGNGGVTDLAFSPDGEQLASGGHDGTIRLWDGHGVSRSRWQVEGYKVNGLAFAHGVGNHRFATTEVDGAIRQWDADTGQPLGRSIQVTQNTLQAITYSADDARLITASRDGVIRNWNPETGRAALPPLRDLGPESASIAASRDGRLLASGDAQGQVVLWNAATGQVLRRLSASHEKVFSVGFSPDGQRIAASGMKGFFALWEAGTGRLIFVAPEVPNSALANLAFSPDGRYVVTADRAQRTLRLWDGRSGRPVARRLEGQESTVEVVAFSPDGRFIASGQGKTGIRFWDVESGEPIGGHFFVGGFVSALAFSADGRYLAASSDSMKTLRVWDGPSAWAASLCRRLTRNMSHSEWQQYVGKSWPYIKQCPGLPVPPD